MADIATIPEGSGLATALARLPSIEQLREIIDPNCGVLEKARRLPGDAELAQIERLIRQDLTGCSVAAAAGWANTLIGTFPPRKDKTTPEYAVAIATAAASCPADLLDKLHAGLVLAHDWCPSARAVAAGVKQLVAQRQAALHRVTLARMAARRLAERDARDAAHHREMDARRAERLARGEAVTPANDAVPYVPRGTPDLGGPEAARCWPPEPKRAIRR